MSETGSSSYIPPLTGKKLPKQKQGVTDVITTRTRKIPEEILNSPEAARHKQAISDRLEQISDTQFQSKQLLLPF